MSLPPGYDAWKLQSPPEYSEDEDEESEFNCNECDEELGDDGICYNEECTQYGEEPYSDIDERKAERQRMGITY